MKMNEKRTYQYGSIFVATATDSNYKNGSLSLENPTNSSDVGAADHHTVNNNGQTNIDKKKQYYAMTAFGFVMFMGVFMTINSNKCWINYRTAAYDVDMI
jgi:hypothetical protein